jgi:peptide/nickel transport system substrate-binding protein
MTPDGIDPQTSGQLAVTRRDVLRGALAGGALLAGGGLLAACGDDNGSGTAAKSNTGGTPATGAKQGGSLRVGVAGGGAKDSIDAHVLTTDPDIARAFQLYEPLAVRNPDYELEMLLAESIEADSKPDSWTVRLREGVTFHDGKPVTADDVLFSLARITDPKDPKTGAASIEYIDLKRSKKLDDRTVRIALQTANVGFPDDLGQYFNGIVPEGYDPKNPVGSGPFRYESFSPGERSVFARNPDYWGGAPKVDEVVIIDFADDTARVNALVGGQVDAISNLPAAQIAQVQGNKALNVLISETGAWQPFTMRVDSGPFRDVKVRQAMRLLVDREQMIGQALSGQGRVGNDLYAPFDPAYASDLPQRAQDVEQAKSLLRQAGQADLRVELVTAPVFQGIVEAAQVFAEQAKAAGVNVKVRKVDSGTFYDTGKYLQWPFAQDFWFTRTYLAQVAQGSLKSSPFNETHWNHPEFVKLVADARRELDEGKRNEMLHRAQGIEYEEGGYIVWSFSNQVDAHSAKVGGFQTAKSGVPLSNYGFAKVGFVA